MHRLAKATEVAAGHGALDIDASSPLILGATERSSCRPPLLAVPASFPLINTYGIRDKQRNQIPRLELQCHLSLGGMNAGKRRRVRVVVVCPPDLAVLRDHLVEVALVRMAGMLDRRGVDLAIEVVEFPDPDDGSGLVQCLRDLAELDSVLLGLIGSSKGAPVEPFPVELESEFPDLVPYEGGGRLELLVRHALTSTKVRTPVFVLVTQPGVAALAALRRAVRQGADRLVIDEDPALPVEELGGEVLNALWRAVIDREAELPEVAPNPAITLDENVQFTIYRPRTLRPMVWYDLLAFAHLAERRPDAPADEPDPLTKVRQQALGLLGPQLAEFDDTRSDARQGIPSGGTLTFLPQVAGVQFNPERRIFRWEEDVHREEFRLRAGTELSGRTARGRLSVYLGAIVVAELDLAFRVDPEAIESVASLQEPPEQARTYRRIFASYSHRDVEIVQQFELLATSLGDDYLRDVVRLRSGEDWDVELHRLIDEADVFQLFWSSNSMRSQQVRREWEYALSLHRPQFVRPTYWEDPLPSTSVPELPPESLRRLHFHHLVDLPRRGARMEGGNRRMQLVSAYSIAVPRSDLTLDVQTRAGQFTVDVKNEQSMADRVVLDIEAIGTDAGAADPAWFVVDRHLRLIPSGGSEQFQVLVTVPNQVASGSFQMKPVAYSSEHPPDDTKVDGPLITVTLRAPPQPSAAHLRPNPPSPTWTPALPWWRRWWPWWLIAVGVAVVLAVAVTVVIIMLSHR